MLLVRGLGQGALSVVSVALVGKWFTRRLGPAIGVFTVLLAVGFVVGTVGLGEAVKAIGYASGMGVAGGIVTVVFFAVHGHAFGRRHLGAIQAVMQVVSVFASALGPWLLTSFKERGGSYDTLFLTAAAAAAVFAPGCWFVRLPRRPDAPVAAGTTVEGSG